MQELQPHEPRIRGWPRPHTHGTVDTLFSHFLQFFPMIDRSLSIWGLDSESLGIWKEFLDSQRTLQEVQAQCHFPSGLARSAGGSSTVPAPCAKLWANADVGSAHDSSSAEAACSVEAALHEGTCITILCFLGEMGSVQCGMASKVFCQCRTWMPKKMPLFCICSNRNFHLIHSQTHVGKGGGAHMIVTNTLVHRHGGWWTQVQSCHHFDQKGNPRESFVLSMADDERADRSIQLRVLTSRGGLLHEILCQAKPHELINRLAAARPVDHWFPFVPLEKSVEFHVGPPLCLGSK